MADARLRALTLTIKQIIRVKWTVEMADARLRALTHPQRLYRLQSLILVEMADARLRALTHINLTQSLHSLTVV